MGPLIEITTVPIEIEMKTTNAHLVYSRGTAEVEISRDKGGLNIKSRPIKLNVDSFQAQSSIRPTTAQSVKQAAQAGAAGDPAQLMAMMDQLMHSKEGAELVNRIDSQAKQAGLK